MHYTCQHRTFIKKNFSSCIYTCICKYKTKNVSVFSYFCKFTFITQFYATTKEKLKIK